MSNQIIRGIRIFLGTVIAGPIAGIFAYLTNPAGILFGLIGGILAAYLAWPILMPIIVGHTLGTLTAQAVWWFKNNYRAKEGKRSGIIALDPERRMTEQTATIRQLNQLSGLYITDGFLVKDEQIRTTPIACALDWGFQAANAVAGEAIYTQTANELANQIDGLPRDYPAYSAI